MFYNYLNIENLLYLSITYFFINNLIKAYKKNNDSKDFIKEIIKNGGECYLTGENLYLTIKNDDFNDNNYDIVVNKLKMSHINIILRKIGINPIYFDYKTNNNGGYFNRCTFTYGDNNYEISLTNDRKYTFNTINYPINNLEDVSSVKYIFKAKNLTRRQIDSFYNNTLILNDDSYIEDIYDVLRCFKLSVKYNLKIDVCLKELLMECCNDIIDYKEVFNYSVIYKELTIIFEYGNIDILNLMYECKIFKILNMDIKNYDNFYDFNPPYLKKDIKCSDLKFILFMSYYVENFNEQTFDVCSNMKNMILFLREFDKQKFENKHDVIKYLTDLNFKNRIHYNLEEYSNRYAIDFKYYNIENNIPITIHDLNISGEDIINYKNCKYTEINRIKKELLFLIQDGKLNTYDEIINYLKSH